MSHRSRLLSFRFPKAPFYKRRNLFTTASLDTKKALIKSFVRSVALYGAETRTILKAGKSKIEAFEI